MKKLITGLFITVAVALFFAFQVSAANPRPQRTDVVGASEDTFNAEWVAGKSADGGPKDQALALTDFAYYSFRNWWDQKLSDVTKVRASFMKDLAAVNLGGSPRFSLELDANGDGNYIDPGIDPTSPDVNVFLDPAFCGDVNKSGWTDADFTADRTDCAIHDSTGKVYISDKDGTAWSKLVAQYPDAKVWFMFLIQDATTGTNYVDRIMLDSSFFTKEPTVSVTPTP